MRTLGGGRDLQDVLNAVYLGASQECENREHEGKLVGNGHHMAQAIVENVSTELLRRGLFFKGEADGDASVHEQHAQAFLTAVRAILVDAIKLSPETNPDVFVRVDKLIGELRHLFRENTYRAEDEYKKRLRDRLDKLVNEL